MLPPRASGWKGSRTGAVTSPVARPRSQQGTTTSSARTFSNPSSSSFFVAHATARRSLADPLKRWPTSVVRLSRSS